MRPRLRITMVLPSLDVGGMERLTLDLSRNLLTLGHEVSIVCVDRAGELAESAAADSVQVHELPNRNKGRELRRHLRRVRPDVVHLHMTPWLKSAIAARAVKARFINTLHGVPEHTTFVSRASHRLGAALTHEVVLVSDALQGYATETLGIRGDKLSTITNGIDTDRFSPSHPARDIRSELGCGPDAKIVGTVARLAPVKNQQLLIRAMEKLEHRDIHLVLVGDGESRGELVALAESLDLQDRVHFLGSMVDTTPTLLAFDLFVLSSKAEGLPMALLEAMACQIPIVATDVGGIRNLLEDGRLGRIVPNGDLESLTSAVQEMLDRNEASFSKSLKDGRAVCVERYSSMAMAKAYLARYRA